MSIRRLIFQFRKITINSLLRVYFEDPSYQATFNFYLQYSNDILLGNDRLNLGSIYTVRGYSYALSGSSAGYLRSEIIKTFRSASRSSSEKHPAKSISLAFGLDYGQVRCELDNREVCGEIYGIGPGISVNDANFNGRLLWGHPLKQIGSDIGDKDQFTLDLRWHF